MSSETQGDVTIGEGGIEAEAETDDETTKTVREQESEDEGLGQEIASTGNVITDMIALRPETNGVKMGGTTDIEDRVTMTVGIGDATTAAAGLGHHMRGGGIGMTDDEELCHHVIITIETQVES